MAEGKDAAMNEWPSNLDDAFIALQAGNSGEFSTPETDQENLAGENFIRNLVTRLEADCAELIEAANEIIENADVVADYRIKRVPDDPEWAEGAAWEAAASIVKKALVRLSPSA